MHLAVCPGNAAVFLQNYGGVVIDTGRAALEEGQYQHYAQFTGKLAETLCRRAWNGLGKVTELCVFLLAEIQAVVQFLKNHKLCALCCTGADTFLKTGDVPGDVCGAVLLHHSYFERSHYL